MKRISLLFTLSLLAPGLCQGYYVSSSCRPQFSSYAFGYRHSGLVSRGLRFSSHALSYDHCGLVYAGTRFSSYALSYRNPGLVVGDYHRPAVCGTIETRGTRGTIDRYNAEYSTRCTQAARVRGPLLSAAQRHQIQQTDGTHVIRRYLANQGIRGVKANYGLGIENKTASIAFILRDRNLVIRYRNPDVLQAAENGADHEKNALERHERRWEAFADRFQAAGGTVYDIRTSDEDRIVAALDSCELLNETGDLAGPVRMYAKH